MKNLTLTEVKSILYANYAKSSYYKDKFINLASGIYSEKAEVFEMVAFQIRGRVGDFKKHKFIMIANTAIDFMPEIERYQAEQLNNRLWVFFRDQFKGYPSFKVKGYTLFKQYQKEFGNVSAKQFYTDLNAWAAEHKYKVTYKNRLINRWVIVSV